MLNIEEIKALLQRNKLRLYQELSQSKEAMYLIKKSIEKGEFFLSKCK